MPKFSIRDDDTSFFTSPEDLDAVYAPYWGRLPIALSVIPFSVSEHRGNIIDSHFSSGNEVPLGENRLLVEWLQEKIRLGHIQIMLHGYNHQYKNINGSWIGEYGWKSTKQLLQETNKGKRYLENLLDVDVQIFVPPSNTIGNSGIRAIRNAGLHLSGIMGRGGDRPLTMDYPKAYLKRWGWRLIKGDAYPFPISLGGIKELRAYALTPRAAPQCLMSQLLTCAKLNAPFVVATHYWEFNESPGMHKTLATLISAASDYQFDFVPIHKCY